VPGVPESESEQPENNAVPKAAANTLAIIRLDCFSNIGFPFPLMQASFANRQRNRYAAHEPDRSKNGE
jgi:hypothetical protein